MRRMVGRSVGRLPLHEGEVRATARERGSHRHGVVILAAGASRRMGTPKGLLSVKGVPVLATMVERLTALGAGPTVVVVGPDAASYLRDVPPQNFRYVVHEGWERGRTSSVKAGLKALGGHFASVLLWPVDHPFVSPVTIASLWAECRTSPGSWIVPRYDGKRGHPPLLTKRALDVVMRYPDAVPLRQFPAEHPEEVVEVEVPDRGVLQNIDTPADLLAALRASRGEA